MLFKYLTELKKSLGKEGFKTFMLDVERDIKFNRVTFNKRTTTIEFINICEGLKMALSRC